MRRPVFLLDQGETMGGAERFLVDFCNMLTTADLRRVSPIVVGGKHPVYREMLAEEIPILPFWFPTIKGSFVKKPFILMKILVSSGKLDRLIVKTNPKAVYTNTPRTHLVMWAASFFWGTKVDWHVMIHDFTTPKWLLKSLGKRAKIVAVNSMGTREDTRAKMRPEDYDKIRIIENGIDTEIIPEATPSEMVQKILVIGRIDRRKGQDYSLQIARIMKDRHPSMHFYIVGLPFKEDPKTEAYYKELKAYAKKYDLSNVTFVGEVKNSFEAYINADVVLFTPVDPEPFGRVTIEGLAMGKLVLAFNQTGPREVLQQFHKFCAKTVGDSNIEDLNMILTKSCDVLDMVASLEYFYEYPEKMEVFTKLGRPFIKEYFPLKETKKRLLQLFED